MNTILTFLCKNQRRLALQAWGDPARWSCVLATPRFRASSHVIFFILPENGKHPILIAKVPRLPGDHSRLEREMKNLQAGFHARPGGFDSIPRVITFEEYGGHQMLIETAVSGQPMKPAFVRRQPGLALEATVSWLLEFHRATAQHAANAQNSFIALVEEPIARLRDLLPAAPEEENLLQRTLAVLQPLRTLALPCVLAHEDLSHPNILISAAGQVGVVDWELAEPRGYPVLDLFFFLNYIAFARRGASKDHEYLSAFQEAFFGAAAWTRPYVVRYQKELDLPRAALPPLFVLCWLRYLAGLAARLHDGQGGHEKLPRETLHWLRGNRYYLLWRHALEHVQELNFAD